MNKKIKNYLNKNDIQLHAEYQKAYKQVLTDYGINPNSTFSELMSTYAGEFSGSKGTIMNVAGDLSNREQSYNLKLQRDIGLDKKYLQLLTAEYDDYLLYNIENDTVVLIEGMNDKRLKEQDFDNEWNSFDDFLEVFFDEIMTDWIWIFHGEGAMLSTAVFTDFEKAEEWIKKYSLSGVLTKMPLNQSVYDWAVEKEMFTPKTEFHKKPGFIQQFTSASLEHFHYKKGESGKKLIGK